MSFRLPNMPPTPIDDAIVVVALLLTQHLVLRAGYPDDVKEALRKRIKEMLDYLNMEGQWQHEAPQEQSL